MIVGGGKVIAAIVDIIDRYIIDAIVGLVSRGRMASSAGLRFTQTGQIQTYGLVAGVRPVRHSGDRDVPRGRCVLTWASCSG